ncbi:HNH endonuclease [Pedobacter yulinensis]|uniref:HNH endonuclease n=1 Tax=Pedobacter yulinensis TaxID=2126353 RepID=A0A2T3HN59_9SPHI|nr:HNH endonuclease [Pedobacter yulinensis]PST83890.1 HNH endonuclease [Pedobacter yulinensis]
MRNPKWHRDELILALDLYFKTEPGKMHARNAKIIELSRILNLLPIHGLKDSYERFRNPNGVGLKLSNFLAIDPTYTGKGMEAFGKLDSEVFYEFQNEREKLESLAREIRNIANNPDSRAAIAAIPYSVEDEDFTVREGQIIYKLHKLHERNRTIIQKKKESYWKKYHRLDCEVCSFDYHKFYGSVGRGYIECHHRTPLHQIAMDTQTALADLALVCANCHRMLHRDTKMTIETLRERLHTSQ